jgi:hypothetical protein
MVPLSEWCLFPNGAFVRMGPLSKWCLCPNDAFVQMMPLQMCLAQLNESPKLLSARQPFLKSHHPIPWRDSISRYIAPVSSVAGGDNTTRPRLRGVYARQL